MQVHMSAGKCKVNNNEVPLHTYCCLVSNSCLTLCDPMDWNPPDSSAHGISQAKIMECVATDFSNTPVRTAKTQCWLDVEQQELSLISSGNAKSHSHFGRQFGSFLQIQAYSQPHDSVIVLLGIYPNELKINDYRNTYTHMFIVAVYI